MAREIEADEEDTPAPKGDAGEKLKLVAHYAMLGFAPVVSVIALGVALFATGNHSDRAQISELNSRIDKLNASLSASREEMENLKFSMSREKSQRADERKKEEEHDAKIVQSITRLQEKLKIVPTLEEQLRVAPRTNTGASPVAGTTAAPVAAPAPAAADKTLAASAPATASAAKKPAAAIPAPKVDEKKSAAATPATKAEEKKKVAPAPKAEENMSPQVKALKKAIDQYNKQ
jgi:hypothetical protein